MDTPALVVLAAGLSTRYGRLKQLDPVGPEGQALMDYAIADAIEAGVGRVVLVVRSEIEAEVRTHVRGQLERRGLADRAEVVTALQRLDDLPAGRTPPPGRTRPWGTAHALHAARHALHGTSAFVMVNADDGYGRDAVRRIVAWATGRPDPAHPGPEEFALVPFRLEATLSEHGGVSRGVVEIDESGWLRGIREAVEVRRAGEVAIGRWATTDNLDGEPARLALDTPVSLNLWGFTSAVLPMLEGGLEAFLQRSAQDARSEYFVPDVVRQAIEQHAAGVRVLEPAAVHVGMTHPEDREEVVAALRNRGGAPRH